MGLIFYKYLNFIHFAQFFSVGGYTEEVTI